MTREYLYEKYNTTDYEDSIETIIDDIYDYFESRTCGNCRYYSDYDKLSNTGDCNAIHTIGTDDSNINTDYCWLMPRPTFGCNMFEHKDE